MIHRCKNKYEEHNIVVIVVKSYMTQVWHCSFACIRNVDGPHQETMRDMPNPISWLCNNHFLWLFCATTFKQLKMTSKLIALASMKYNMYIGWSFLFHFEGRNQKPQMIWLGKGFGYHSFKVLIIDYCGVQWFFNYYWMHQQFHNVSQVNTFWFFC
jgi:hypothetical protein